MGMGYGANYADVIEAEHVMKLAPKGWAAINALWEEDQLEKDAALIVLHHLVHDDQYGIEQLENYYKPGTPLGDDETWEERAAAYKKAWDELHEEFMHATASGGRDGSSFLDLGIGYHNADDEGDRYDEVDGVYFTVGGVYKLTRAGERFKDIIERKFYVTFG